MQKPTLLILAAGMGSRYGGIKQLDSFGPNGETIIDYSLFDAIRAGFGKVVFIIREELKGDFESVFSKKLAGKIDYEYAIQEVSSYVPKELGTIERTKPWGTGHAVLCAWENTKTPFAVINADDFYGAEAYEKMSAFLSENNEDNLHAMVGYQVKNTLSENGTVSRGVCQTNENGQLIEVIERTQILRKPTGEIVFIEGEDETVLDENATVSMNFWGFKPNVFPEMKSLFEDYAAKNIDSPKAEFYIPTVMSHLIETNLGNCQVFDNSSNWFGVTYPDDKTEVTVAISELVTEGKYPAKLWE
ncbi:MAG: NDP-sugar pyrophosphorylase family protein [Spirosomataceae bacterium]|jgi:NDP-sugar pyrophosphorylase family protein